jgi:acyl-coenzyme A synthetase/AMP-(fatty) acid ligase
MTTPHCDASAQSASPCPASTCRSRTPDRVVFRDELPTNATGKILRRELIRELTTESHTASKGSA